MNDEMFRLSLIEFMNKGLLNDFVNKIFNYRIKDGEYIYIQYKLINGSIILNIYDRRNYNNFKAFIFSNDNIENNEKNAYYINIEECYDKYKKKETKKKLYLLGALLREKDNNEKKKIISYLDNNNIKNILLKYFIV